MQHHPAGPSSAERIIECPASLKMTRNMPPLPESEWSEEGTTAHDWADKVVTHKARLPQVPEHYRPAVAAWYKYCTPFADTADAWGSEERVSLEHVIEGCFGTTDFWSINDGVLNIIDFKFGQGVAVDVEGCTQLLLYASGIFHRYEPLFDIEKIVLHIVQPRLYKNAKRWEVPSFEAVEEVEQALFEGWTQAQTKAPNFKAGDHCKFCPARARCYARFQPMLKALASHINWYKPLDDDTLEDVMLAYDLARDAIGHVSGELFKAAAGKRGQLRKHKIVVAKGRARWAPDSLTKLSEAFGELVTEQKMQPVSVVSENIEALYGENSEEVELLNQYVLRGDGQETLVPMTDPRPPAKSAERFFKKVTKND